MHSFGYTPTEAAGFLRLSLAEFRRQAEGLPHNAFSMCSTVRLFLRNPFEGFVSERYRMYDCDCFLQTLFTNYTFVVEAENPASRAWSTGGGGSQWCNRLPHTDREDLGGRCF